MSRRAPLRRLASHCCLPAGNLGPSLSASARAAGLRSGRLGSPRRRGLSRASSGPGHIPPPEQEGLARSQLRPVREVRFRREHSAAGSWSDTRERLPDRPAPIKETVVLTEDRDVRAAVQEVLPHSQNQGGRGCCFRVM